MFSQLEFPDSKIQDIVIFAVKFSYFSKSVWHMKLSQISLIGKNLSGDPVFFFIDHWSCVPLAVDNGVWI